MYCPKCGSNELDTATACSVCNNPLKPTAQPNNGTQSPRRNGTPESRFNFVWKKGPQKVKQMNYIAVGLSILCVLLLFISATKTVNGSIFKIPILTTFGNIVGIDDISEVQDELDEMVDMIDEALEDDDEMEDFYREYHIDLEDFQHEYGMSIKKFTKLISPLSMNSYVKISEILDEAVGLSDEAGGFKVIINMVNISAFILIALTALGAFLGKTWLMVLSYILSIGFLLAFGGIFIWILASAAFIATAVFFSKLKFEYKLYLRSFGL